MRIDKPTLTKIATFTDNGFLKTSGGDGTLGVDTATYLTAVTAHNVLSTTHGDTSADTVVRGDVMIGNSTPKWSRLAFPASPTGKVLIATATDVTWSTNALGTAAYSATGDFLAVGGTAADSSKLNGQSASYYQTSVGDTTDLTVKSLTIGKNGAGGTAASITLRDGANPGTTATLTYAKWADLEAVNGIVKCNGSGDYSAISGTSSQFVKGDGSLDSSTYLTSLSGAVLTDQTSGQTIGATGARLTKLWATDITCTNAISGSVTGNAGTVTNGIYTTSDATALAATSAGNKGKYLYSNASTGVLEWATVTGTGASTALDNLASVAINAALVLGTSDAFALGSATKMWSDLFLADGGVINWNNGNATLTHSTGLLTSNVPLSLGTSNALTAGSIELGHASDTTIARVSAGVVSIEGANILVSGGALGTPASGTLTNCTFPTLNQNTTGSAASLSISGQSGLLTFTGLTSSNRAKTIRDAADTILELGGSYTPTGTWTWSSATWSGTPTLNQDTTGSAVYWKTSGTGKAAITGPAAGATRTYTFPDSDQTILYSGGALGTPASGTVTNLTGTASININGTVGATTANTIVGTTITANTGLVPDADDGAYIGTTTLGFSDLFLASGATIHCANTDWVATHSAGILTIGTGTLKITTPTNTATSVVTIDGTQTLTNKTLTSPNVNEAVALTTTATKLNYLTSATGTAGTATGKIVFDTAPTFVTSITTPSVLATANDSGALGASGTAFSDLFLASGGVINWNAANVTLTHSAGILTLSAGTVFKADHIGETTGSHTIVFDNTITNAGQSDLTTIHSTTTLADHIGEHTGSHTVVADNTITLATGAGMILPAGSGIKLTLPTTDAQCTGHYTDSFNSGYTASAGDLVFYGSGGKWLEVDSDAVATCNGLLGIAMEAKNDGQAMKVALPGSFVHFDAWNWTTGDTLYAGETLGAIQNTIPTGADAIIKVVGVAIDADTIYFYPSQDQQSTVA